MIALFTIGVASVALVAKEKIPMIHGQHGKHSGMNHAEMDHGAMNHDAMGGMPTEFGEAGFAAIAEIVNLLSKDPDTDWSNVNINALREHLVMMNQLVLGANVEEQAIPNGRRFTVSGSGQVLKAIQQMVPAHARELNKMSEYTTSTSAVDGGVVLNVEGDSDITQAKIKGLGFFGLMSIGSHHQMHHMMMASGQGHH